MRRTADFNHPSPYRLHFLTSLLVGPLLMAGMPILTPLGVPVGALMVGFVAGMVLFAASVIALVASQRFKRGEVEIDSEKVRLGDGVPIPRASIQSAFFAPGSGPLKSVVRMLDANERLLGQVVVANETEANEVLDALKLGPASRIARLQAMAPKGSLSRSVGSTLMVLGTIGFVLAMIAQLPIAVGVGLIALIGGSAAFLPCKVDIGADGMLIKTRISPRFVSWGEVESIETYPKGILVRCKSKETITLPTTTQMFPNARDKVIQGSLLTRAQAALASYRRDDDPDVAARVARGGRKHEEWMRALFDREGSFRTAPVIDDQLWNIVESPTADTTARAGAAAVLARQAGEAERARLRIAADACTSPKLRVVLDKSATGAPATEVEEALVDLEEDDELRTGAAR